MGIAEEVARLEGAEKSFGAEPWWLYDNPDEDRFVLSVPLNIEYVTEEGFYLQGSCLRSLSDQNVTLTLLYRPASGFSGPIARFDWKPLHSHENRGMVKGEWKWNRFCATHL